tara:strand:+ start:9760 stop:9990 length:231 start_codon:yes stop_codon:yes gene_type:complete
LVLTKNNFKTDNCFNVIHDKNIHGNFAKKPLDFPLMTLYLHNLKDCILKAVCRAIKVLEKKLYRVNVWQPKDVGNL